MDEVDDDLVRNLLQYSLFYATVSYKKSAHVGVREILLRLVPHISGASEECHEEWRVVDTVYGSKCKMDRALTNRRPLTVWPVLVRAPGNGYRVTGVLSR